MVQGTIVFAGDSVTDCGRREDPEGLGHGYVRLLAGHETLIGARVRNAGVGGDRLTDLGERWHQDVVALEPDLVTVLIGINDTWRGFDSGQHSDPSAFEERYRGLLGALEPVTRIVLMEPFVLPVDTGQEAWRPDVETRIDAVHRLAVEFGATLVPTDRALRGRAEALGAQALAADGVHPTPLGHREIADAWIRAVER